MSAKRERIQPDKLHVRKDGDKVLYSQVMVVEVGGTKQIFVAGQTPRDKHGNCVGKGDMRAQIEQVGQNIKDALRLAFRDTHTTNEAAKTLGYYNELDFEGAVITVDHECPTDRTISLCAASMDLNFYGESSGEGGAEGARQGYGGTNSQVITGGIYTVFGPERPAGSLETVWIMIAGGQARYNPKWHACHKDFTTGV